MRLCWLLLALLLPCGSGSLSAQQEAPRFEFLLSSGPFGLPGAGRSIDWVVINNAPDSQDVRVAVWELRLNEPKVAAMPGALTFRLAPGATFHNANQIGHNGPFRLGYYYEATVELNDRRVLPSVEVWSDDWGRTIPGTRVGPTSFVLLNP